MQRSSSTNTSSTYFGGTLAEGSEVLFTGSPEEQAFISTLEFPTTTQVNHMDSQVAETMRNSDMLMSNNDDGLGSAHHQTFFSTLHDDHKHFTDRYRNLEI